MKEIEVSMKPIARITKSLVIAQIQAESRRAAGPPSSLERRLLSVSLAKGKELEPAGRLAGTFG